MRNERREIKPGRGSSQSIRQAYRHRHKDPGVNEEQHVNQMCQQDKSSVATVGIRFVSASGPTARSG